MKRMQLKKYRNIIEFPNDMVGKKILKNKLEVAYNMLDYLTEGGVDFQIIIESNAAKDFFREEDLDRDFVILTSNVEKSKKLKISTCIYPLTGNELD